MCNSRRVSRPWRPLVLLPVLAAALTSAACSRSADPLIDNERERDEVILACPGRIEGLSEAIAVNAGIDGVLEAVDVREGEFVVAGQVIAKVSRAELAAELGAARAALEGARQARTRLLRGSREEERRRAAAEKVAAEAVVKQARSRHQRVAQLFQRGVFSREVLEESERNLEVAASTLHAAEMSEELIRAAPLPEEVARADADVRAAEERVRTVAARLEKHIVRAPISGTVLRCHLKPGESVSTAFPRPILILADITRLRVRAEVDERDVGRIFLNQRALVLADAFPGRRFEARVWRVSAAMGRKKVQTGDPTEKSDRDVLEVLANLEEKEPPLVVGLRVTVQFLRRSDPPR